MLLPFLKSSDEKKMIFISSKMGSMEATEIGGQAAGEWTSSVSYRMSKAALNMGVRCFAAEIGGKMNSGVCFTAVHPGWVDTDMGSAGGRIPPLSPQQSIQSMLGQVVDVMENDTHNGTFRNYDGTVLPW
jgi:NAD(P)-dependent dehydrogenase (short-subunit alcohol dehydrogenase family)